MYLYDISMLNMYKRHRPYVMERIYNTGLVGADTTKDKITSDKNNLFVQHHLQKKSHYPGFIMRLVGCY